MMNNAIYLLANIVNIILGFFSTFIVFDFLKRFNRKIFYPKYVYVIAYLIFTLTLFLIGIFSGNGTINLFVTFIGILLIGHFLYNKEKIYLLYYSIYVVMLFLAQSLVALIFNISCVFFNINFYNIIIYGVTLSTITQFVYLGLSRAFIILFKNRKIKKISRIQYLNFFVLPAFSTIYVVTLLMYLQTYMGFSDVILIIFNIISLIILNLFITDIFESISRNNELQNKIKFYEEQSKIQYEYYNSLENNYRNSRKVIHDIKNHLQIIEDLYKGKEYDKGNEYAKDMYKLLDSFSQKIYTNNRTLNLIINDKMLKAKENGINLECKIGDINIDFMKDIDITTIFANLLDNALEEQCLCKEERKVFLKIDSFNQFIIINLTNKLSSKLVKDKKFFKSTKKNHCGFGLENVSLALEKYEGNMRIDTECGEFKINIIIPINE